MQSALIVHSKHTLEYAKKIANDYKDVEFLLVENPPTEDVLKIKTDKDIVIGIGGGSVIDTAKVISKDKSCIAIPTTASGAAVTPYATVWGDKKISVQTKIPILKSDNDIKISLPETVKRSTLADALSHAIEAFWAKSATNESKEHSKRAISLIKDFLSTKDINTLIKAGNVAGRAIAIAKTNVIHATSYSISIKYKVDHGIACGMLLPYFVEFMDFKGLPELFGFKEVKEVVNFLKPLCNFAKIDGLDANLIAQETMKYGKINEGPKNLNVSDLENIILKANQ